jgi:hypothetical protein
MDTHEVKLTDAEEQFSKYYQVTEDAINALQ